MSVGLFTKRIMNNRFCADYIDRCISKFDVLCFLQYFSTKGAHRPTKVEVNPEPGDKQVTKKTARIPKITLIHDNQLSVTSVEEAQKISKRRDLKLVKIVDVDTKTQRPVYKLITGAEYYAEDLKQRELKKQERQSHFKGEKVIVIGQNIYEHDLQIQLKKIMKWIGKSYEVKVVINGNIGNMEKADQLYCTLEKAVGSEGRIVQKRQKGSDIRFQILPPKNNDINCTS